MKRKSREKGKDGLSRSNPPPTSIKPSRHAPDALLPATLQIASLVEIGGVHVALKVRGSAAVVAKQTLDVEEFAAGFLRADVLAGFVGFAVFGDVVG